MARSEIERLAIAALPMNTALRHVTDARGAGEAGQNGNRSMRKRACDTTKAVAVVPMRVESSLLLIAVIMIAMALEVGKQI